MSNFTTKFVHDFIEKLKELNAEIPGNENLGQEVRKFLMNYKHPKLAVYWWDEIIPSPPDLENKYINKVLLYANKKLTNEEVGLRIRKFTKTFWNKREHTMIWTPFHKENVI